MRLFFAAFIPAVLLFVPGTRGVAVVHHAADFEGALMAGAVPFQIGGVVKSVIAAMIVSGAFAALKNASSK